MEKKERWKRENKKLNIKINELKMEQGKRLKEKMQDLKMRWKIKKLKELRKEKI